MSHERHLRAKEIFLAARRRPRERRGEFVESACGDDRELRREVESLLDVLDRSAGPWSASSSVSGSPPPPPPSIDGYRIVRKLGEGGMGEVFAAEQQGPIRRTVALKVIKWGMDSKQVIARFESERQALALMSHPAIARVFAAGTTGSGRPYFAMEYAPGPPITDYCDQHRLGLRQRLALFLALCDGVQHAHGKGVIHRDIKPGNVLVTTQDGKPVPKLIDFGVAKATERRLTERTLYTELGQWIGTPEYMSPEQAALGSVEIDARTDVYSLGVVLYELLVGVQPFDPALRESGFDEMRRRIREEEPPRPSARLASLGDAEATVAARNRRSSSPALRRRLAGDLGRIAMKAIEKDPGQRYASPGELGEDVERYLSDEPVRASPPGALYRARKLVRRRRLGLAAGAAALAALAAGIASTAVWLQQREEIEAVAGGTGIVEAARAPSIAVLPFVNLSADPEMEYFSDGLSEELLNALAQVPRLRVAARTSSFAYKGREEDVRTIGSSLDVETVLEGSVRRSGDSLRITAQLIDVGSGFHLWSDSFDRQVGDVFAIQDEISRAVAGALEVELLQRRAPAERAAETIGVYDLYLQGRRRLRDRDPEALLAAIGLFEEAIARDPGYALAHTGLAEGLLLLARRGDLSMEEADRRAGAALQRALELDGDLAEAHVVLGHLRSTIGDPDGAESALLRALELNGNLASAHLLLGRSYAARNRPAESDAAYRRALRLDPLNPAVHHEVGRSLMNRGRYDEGMRQFQHWLRVDPGSAETYRLMSMYARTYGRLDDAVVWARRATELGPQAPLNLHELVMAYSGLGELDLADEWMDRAYALAPNNHWTFTLKAFTYLERGDLDGLEEFTQGLLAAEPIAGAAPLPQRARVRLALAALSKVHRGDYREAVDLYERALGEPFTGILELGIDADAVGFLAYAYRRLGRSDEADAAIEKCRELIHSRQDWIWAHLIMPETIAGLYATEGRDDEALETLRQALADGWVSRSVLLSTPQFEHLRPRQDFQRLVEQAESRLAEMRARLRGG